MEFTAPKRDLLALVGQAQGASDKKSAMPVLANVLLTANGGKLHVAATDLYLGVTGSCNVEVTHPGSLALPAKDLLDRVKMMPDGPIVVTERENNSATVKAVGAARRYTVHGMPGSEFPKLPEVVTGSPTLELATSVLAQLIARTHFSVSTDETRAHVNSALFEWAGDVVRMVTTDGHRLSKMEVKLDGKHVSTQMLIPLRALHELKRLVDGARNVDTIRIQQSGATAFFHIGDMLFSLKTVDAQFPPYQQVIPAYVQCELKVPRGALADAVRAVSIAASDRTGGVKLTLENGMLRVTSESPESGNGCDEVPVDAPESAAKLVVGMNAKYLQDVLGALTDDEVTIGMSGELDPITVRQLDTNKRNDVYVIMPMRC